MGGWRPFLLMDIVLLRTNYIHKTKFALTELNRFIFSVLTIKKVRRYLGITYLRTNWIGFDGAPIEIDNSFLCCFVHNLHAPAKCPWLPEAHTVLIATRDLFTN